VGSNYKKAAPRESLRCNGKACGETKKACGAMKKSRGTPRWGHHGSPLESETPFNLTS